MQLLGFIEILPALLAAIIPRFRESYITLIFDETGKLRNIPTY
jgi:hypothetical protein